MTAAGTSQHLLDQARRRFTPTLNNIPGMGMLERRLLAHEWKTKVLAKPPVGSDLKPVLGDSGLPLLGHSIEMYRGGPDFALQLYRMYGPVFFSDVPILSLVNVFGPDAIQAVYVNKDKAFSQKGWYPVAGPFFKRGLMMLDFDEHRYHKRIMQEAFTRTRLAGYVEHIDRVVAGVVARWPANDPRFLFHPAAKELNLDIASMVFMGHEPDADHALVTKVNNAFTITSRAGGAFIRYPVPPFKWWRGLRGRKFLEEYFSERVTERRNTDGTDMLTVLCHAVDEDGNSFSDEDIVNHMVFLLTAAHDTSTTASTAMAYNLAAHPQWQERCRDESAQLGDGPLDIESLEKLETLDLVMNESLPGVTPLPILMRQTVRDTDLLGYYLPARTLMLLWPSMNHRLPELWTEPDKFDPERFAEPRAEHKKHRCGFSPFGGGAHKCIGLVFAQLGIKTVMHRLLRRYRLELVRPGYQPRWDYGGIPIPVDGMPIVLRPLSSAT
jgi:cytochrome P450